MSRHIHIVSGREADGGGGSVRSGIIADRVWTPHVASLHLTAAEALAMSLRNLGTGDGGVGQDWRMPARYLYHGDI